jgi:phenylpropionate dioxygenase-like ring-hydroxylating dioxygenase large terminal subunit
MSQHAAHQKPLLNKGRTSVARVTDDWYIVCPSQRLRVKPVQAAFYGTPIVVFRSSNGEAGALLDCCPHRNAPLSLGRVKGEHLQCCYHGWEFDRSGVCRNVPGLVNQEESRGRRAQSFAVRELDGYVWLYATPDAEPKREPFRFPLLDDREYATFRQELEVEATIHAAAENALDVPHTAYLHGGLFRSSDGRRNEIDVVVRRDHNSVEAEYMGEPRPGGVVGRILAPRGGRVHHVDRFILPSIAQIEYKLGESTHICVTNALTPVSDFSTRLFTVVSLRLPFPAALIAPAVKPIIMRIFHQDAEILQRQTAMIRRFGGEQFQSTDIDILGPHIYRLLKQAERGERSDGQKPFTRTLRMII